MKALSPPIKLVIVTYTISVNEVEDLQMVSDTAELQKIFTRAQNIVIQGGIVVLVRTNYNGSTHEVDKITTETDLKNYRLTIFKYF